MTDGWGYAAARAGADAGVGAGVWGGGGCVDGAVSRAEQNLAVARALEAGITYFDTAPG
ncbi:MAG: hypothetical protein U0232_08025 [Thermomicrobiales bacterium]